MKNLADIDKQDIELIAKLYNTSLDPESWPQILLELAHRLGAAGSFIFEEMQSPHGQKIATRLFSENYDKEIVSNYLTTFNDEEISDQARFAELSANDNEVELVSDIYIRSSIEELMQQPNTQFMMKMGLKHRAGALLNKDLYHVDRFSLQYAADHGPMRESEKAAASIFLPHVAKVIGLARPLEEQCRMADIFSNMLNEVDQGIALLGPNGALQFQNNEFKRIVEEHQFFFIDARGNLQCSQKDMQHQFHNLILDGDGHGRFGARARREALIHDLPGQNAALFVEICPISDGKFTGKLDAGSRLVTVIDTSRKVQYNLDRINQFFSLSKSETSILGLVVDGHTNREIADHRSRAPDTIKTQISTLMRKTNSRHRTDLVHMVHNLSSVVQYEVSRETNGMNN